MLANQSSLKNSPDPLICGPGEFFIITTRLWDTLQKTGDNAKYGHVAADKQTMPMNEE